MQKSFEQIAQHFQHFPCKFEIGFRSARSHSVAQHSCVLVSCFVVCFASGRVVFLRGRQRQGYEQKSDDFRPFSCAGFFLSSSRPKSPDVRLFFICVLHTFERCVRKANSVRVQGKTEGKANRELRVRSKKVTLKKGVTLATQDTECNSVSYYW